MCCRLILTVVDRSSKRQHPSGPMFKLPMTNFSPAEPARDSKVLNCGMCFYRATGESVWT